MRAFTRHTHPPLNLMPNIDERTALPLNLKRNGWRRSGHEPAICGLVLINPFRSISIESDNHAVCGVEPMIAENEHEYLARALGEKNRRLTRGVAVADDDDLRAMAQLSLHRGGGVIDA